MRTLRLLLAGATAAGTIALGAPAGAGLLGTTADAGTGGSWTLGGQSCSLIEVPTASPVNVAGSCPGVRPGAIVESDTGQCTFNYLFHGADGERYMGTAGHCVLGEGPTGGDVGERTWAPGTGPEARDSAGNRVGEFAYALLEDPKDFALIRLDAGVEANPQMCHFGGPTGINDDMPGLFEPTVLQHFGQGVGLGLTVPGRSAVALGMPDADHVYAEGVVVPGDSGSAINREDGRAVGVIVTTGFHRASIGTAGLDAGLMGITRLSPQLRQAERVLGTALALQTAPTL